MKTYIPYIAGWVVLTTVVIFLAVYRRRIRLQSDELVHVLDADAGAVPQQIVVAKKLVVIDRWGKLLTVLSVIYLLSLVAMFLYNAFQDQTVKLG